MNCVLALALSACVTASAGCSVFASHSCTDAFFSCNQTTISLRSPNDAWTSGTYELAVTMDGAPGQCSVQVPDPPPVDGLQGSCGSDTTLALTFATVNAPAQIVCNRAVCEGASPTAIPGHFQMTLVILNLPPQVALSLSLDGNAVVSETIAPKATTDEPNGAGCGTCTTATATVSVAGG